MLFELLGKGGKPRYMRPPKSADWDGKKISTVGAVHRPFPRAEWHRCSEEAYYNYWLSKVKKPKKPEDARL